MSFPSDEEVRNAYKVISNHINTLSTRYENDPLLEELRREHPTLQMNLLRVLKRACADRVVVEDGKVTYFDGRYSEEWARFVAFSGVPII